MEYATSQIPCNNLPHANFQLQKLVKSHIISCIQHTTEYYVCDKKEQNFTICLF